MAPRASGPAIASASGSACGRPPEAVTARPTTRPSRTTTQPTEGLGQVVPRPRRASASAARMCAASPAAPSAGPPAALRPISGAISGTGSPAVSRVESTLRGSAIARLVGFAQRADEILEILRLAEVAVDAGEADIGHRIQLLQRVHHQLADLLGGDVALARGLELAHHAVNDPLDPFLLDRPLAQRDTDRARELVAVERHPPSVRLHHGQFAKLYPLDRGEALAAIAAGAAATDRRVVLGRTAVLDLGIVVATERAAHF